MKRIFNNVVFTDHALERLEQRNIKQGDAWATMNNPDSCRQAQRKKSWVFYRTWGNRRVEVVASKNEKKQWVVLSVWDTHVGKWQKSKTKMSDPIWKRVIKEFARVFTG
ncbi:DUF4258 domain-containing protein [Patescibacteria group bacterium]